MRHSWWPLMFAAAVVGCATSKDARDETPDAGLAQLVLPDGGVIPCGTPTRADVAFLRASDTQPAACIQVTLAREVTACDGGAPCAPEPLFQGLTNPAGLVQLGRGVPSGRLLATAEGYAPSVRPAFPPPVALPVVVELQPSSGLLLKVVDELGSPMTSVPVTVRQGETVLGELRTNTLSNVYLPERPTFDASRPLTLEVEGFPPVVVRGPEDLGEGYIAVIRSEPLPVAAADAGSADAGSADAGSADAGGWDGGGGLDAGPGGADAGRRDGGSR